MKVCKTKCWMTADRKLLVEDGNAGSAYLCAIPGQEVADSYAAKFDNGSDFFEDVKRHVEPIQNIGISDHEDVKPVGTGNRSKEKQPKAKKKGSDE